MKAAANPGATIPNVPALDRKIEGRLHEVSAVPHSAINKDKSDMGYVKSQETVHVTKPKFAIFRSMYRRGGFFFQDILRIIQDNSVLT